MSAKNVDILRGVFDAFNQGDIDTVMGILDDNITWHEPEDERLPFGGTHRGSQQVAEKVFQTVTEYYDDYHVVPEEYLDAGHNVVVLGRFEGRAKATGRTLNAPFAHVWTLRDEKVANFRDYTDTAQFLRTLG